ncbi:MAG: phage tail tape measure protein [Flavobacterium sp. MedPE-SWcel]|uniref:phage tail tape measure protein n=1 Tax=uncultured Flavobacterium sp. TaxID=165435 RepID=UPI0009164856|nr:phage tail tape measure protein [uncultured Flavobacterium sp.]OIQ22060.1 MAG: phage tail tape measure protein [Flavobacterium sp. MedPE-SWcel]
MAKKISDEKLKLTIIINGNEAQKELFDLEKSMRDLNGQQKELRKEKQLLEKQNKKSTNRYKAVNKAIRENNATLRVNKTRMKELQDQIGLTGLTFSQLRNKANLLRLKLQHVIPGSTDYKRYDAELKQITARMDQLKGKSRAAAWSIGGLADKFNRFAALGATLVAMTTGVILSLQKMIDYNGKLAGAQSNVRKTVGLTKKEVDELTKSFGMLRSRTARIDLLKIAEEGGRIGIVKDEIQEFVGVMDKANVALGDSFKGGPEEVAEKLGKIKFLFKETKEMGVQESYMAIGSAINELGANGLASERNIANFTNRIGSLTDVLKPSVSETLALGAAFEESGIEAEVSSRAYNIFMKQAANHAGKFGKVMGKSREEIEALINANPLEFMLQFSEGLRGMNATNVAKTLKYLGLNADGANKAIGAMGNNTDRFRELLILSNEAFEEGTSLIDEYNIKNNDLEATLSKIKKTVTGWFSSEGLVAWLAAAAEWFAKFIGATDDADGSGKKWRDTLAFTAKALAVVIAAMVTSTAWMKLMLLWQTRNTQAGLLYNLGLKTKAALEAIAVVRTRAMVLAQNLLNLNIRGSIQAFKALSAAMMTTPFGLILGIIAAVTTAYIAFRDSANEAAAAVKTISATADVQNEHMKALSKTTTELKSKIEPLIKILKDESASLAIRKIAYENLIKISPDFIDTVDKEFKATNKLTEAYDALIKKLDQAALAKAREKVRKDRSNAVADAEAAEFDAKLKADAEAAENERKRKSNEKEAAKALERMRTSTSEYAGYHARQENYSYEAQEAYEKAKKEHAEARKALQNFSDYQSETIAKLQEELKKHKEGSKEALRIQAEIDALLGNIGSSTTPNGNSGYTVVEEGAEKATQKSHDKRMKALEKFQAEILGLSRKSIDARLALMEEGIDKEEAIEIESHRRKVEGLKKQLIAQDDIRNADKKISDPKSSEQDVAYWTKQKEVWLEKNKHIYELLELQLYTHRLRMAKITEQGENNKIDKLQEQFEAERIVRKTAHNYELTALGANEIAKEELQREFDSKELQRQEAHLKELLDTKVAILQDRNKNIDFSLLTPEQRTAMEQEIADLKLKISEIVKAKGDLSRKGGTDNVADAFGQAFGSADVLGYTADQWGATFSSLDTLSEKLEATKMVIGSLQNVWGTYNEFVNSNENAQVRSFASNTDYKKKRLKWQLDNGFINQVQYTREVERLDTELDHKKADVEYKQAKRQKAMAAINILLNTSQAIMGIWAQVPKFDFGVSAGLLTKVVAALGAVQLGMVLKQPLPARGYEKGLYPEYVKREQDGKLFRSTYGGTTRSGLVTKPTHFLTGENGPEMIIDSKAYRQMSPETKNALVRELRGIKGFEQGYYSDKLKESRYEVPGAATAPQNTTENTISTEYLLSVISRNSDIMERAIEEGFTGYFSRDPRDLNKLKKEMDRIEKSKEKARN